MKKPKKTYVVTITMTRYLDQDLTDANDNEFEGTTEEKLHQQLLAEINDCIDEGRLGGILGEPQGSVWLDGVGPAPHDSTGPRLALLAGGKA